MQRKLDKVPDGTILRLGGMTDCFQPCEEEYRVTLETIKLLNERRIGYLIVTKSDLICDYMHIAKMQCQQKGEYRRFKPYLMQDTM